MPKTEVLSPAGSYEALVAAVRGGCDAVYVGAKEFSARANAKNFDAQELKKAADYCHLHNVKIYQAINTVVLDQQLPQLYEALKTACEIGIDAIIVQDLAVAFAAKELCPSMPLHASTQMTIHSESGILFAKNCGFERVVLSRELSRKRIKELCQYAKSIDVEIEAFVHGALCMSVSGQCYMSAMYGSRSANRGQCAQACRLPFTVDGIGENVLSLKDLCLADEIKELADMGVTSLKIEGRMKRPEYCYLSAKTIKSALLEAVYSVDELSKVFSRNGFTKGYFESKLDKDMFGWRRYEDVLDSSDILPTLANEYKKERKSAKISFKLTARLDKELCLFATDGDINVEISGDVPSLAKNVPTDYGAVLKQLSKLGDTIYELDSLEADIDDNLYIAASTLNDMRRRACDELDKRRIEKNTVIKQFDGNIPYDFPKFMNIVIPKLWISLEKYSQLNELLQADETLFERIGYVVLPIDELENIAEFDKKENIILSLPRFMWDENELVKMLDSAKALGFSDVLITNCAQLEMCKGFNMHGAAGLNITNSIALSQYAQYGLCDTLASFELTAVQINQLGSFLPTGIIGYGKLPLMMCVNCPAKAQVGCRDCKGFITDRMGMKNPLDCHKKWGYVEIKNALDLVISDKLESFFSLSHILLCFSDESASRMLQIINAYENKTPLDIKEFTRGLYFRGIK